MASDSYDSNTIRWWIPLALLASVSFLGILLGALTNFVNGRVSPYYFAAVMRWSEADAPEFAIYQGMLEGGVLGIVFGIVFSIATAASTRLRCRLQLPLKIMFYAILAVIACWIVGGLIGLTLAAAAPNVFRPVLIGAPGHHHIVRFGWVGGTIWGVYGGTLLSLIWGCIQLHLQWRKLTPKSKGFEPVFR